MRKILQEILQAAWSRKGKRSPGIRRSLVFYSFYMEMVVLVLWIDLPCLCFLVTSSPCSVPSLFFHQCCGTVTRSSGNLHPPPSLSDSQSIYSRQKGAGGCLTSLFFWTEPVGNFQMWHRCRGKPERKCSHSHGELGALHGAARAWGGPQTGPFFLHTTHLGLLSHPLSLKACN